MVQTIDIIREVVLNENRDRHIDEILDLFSKADRFVLYQATSSNFLEGIRRDGLLARQLTGNSTYEGQTVGDEPYESQPDKTYVGSLQMARGLVSPITSRHGGNLVVVRCLVDKADLLPDEDSKRDTGVESLAYTQTAAIQGKVPPERLLGVHMNGGVYVPWRNFDGDLITFDEHTFPDFFVGEF